MNRTAVILCGAGSRDGSEIHESTLALLALSERGIEYDIFAPDQLQADLCDHLSGEASDQNKRNCMIEAARIARGKVKPLTELDIAAYDGLIVPGGFGTAKNLFTYAFDGLEFSVLPDFERVVREFHRQGKPIGFMCIAPLAAAKIFEGSGLILTLGERSDLARGVEQSFGVKVVECARREAIVDERMRVVTTPCYMYADATVADIYACATALVGAMSTL